MSREILSPPLQRIGNRCYRVNVIHEDFGGHPSKQRNMQQAGTMAPAKQGYTEPDLYDEDDDDDADDSYTIDELANFSMKLTMHVPQAFYGGLVGFKGNNKRRIESETQTEIHIPRGGKEENLTIKGKTRSSVLTARRRINLQVASLRKRLKATHFLSIPFNKGEVRDKFNDFKKAVLAAQFPGIDEDLFQLDNCIHITICVCVLLDDAERSKAVKLLESCKQFLTPTKSSFEITVSGLEIMNDDPSSVRVLYAGVAAPELQEFANSVFKHFADGGLNNEQRESVKLHMTVMNSRYRKKVQAGSANNFDSREILKRFGDFYFGTIRADELHLCVLDSKKRELGEYYKVTGMLKLEANN